MRAPLALASLVILGLAVLAAMPELVPGRGHIEDVTAGGGLAVRPVSSVDPVRTTVAVQTYPVTGSRAGEVLASMAAAAPSTEGETFFGLTVTELSFRYVREATARGCTLRDVEIALAVTFSLPEWTPGAGTEDALRRDWARFDSNLRRHEDRHRALAEAGAEAILRELDGLSAPTCGQADAEARRRAERVRIETDAAHRRYDDETGHGRTQGAVWPLT
jgi:predicted secreted Zn-dependent protease